MRFALGCSAVSCSVLQCAAVRGSALQCVSIDHVHSALACSASFHLSPPAPQCLHIIHPHCSVVHQCRCLDLHHCCLLCSICCCCRHGELSLVHLAQDASKCRESKRTALVASCQNPCVCVFVYVHLCMQYPRVYVRVHACRPLSPWCVCLLLPRALPLFRPARLEQTRASQLLQASEAAYERAVDQRHFQYPQCPCYCCRHRRRWTDHCNCRWCC
mmetsp:Transcript_19001/g.27948  ORF Transcript_19001/g.27948 Transcript_19001/m.27948 type:complete len:216 (-) Transcript_19001:29-676(-)